MYISGGISLSVGINGNPIAIELAGTGSQLVSWTGGVGYSITVAAAPNILLLNGAIKINLASIAQASGHPLPAEVLGELTAACQGLSEQRVRQLAARALARRGQLGPEDLAVVLATQVTTVLALLVLLDKDLMVVHHLFQALKFVVVVAPKSRAGRPRSLYGQMQHH